MSRLSVFVYQCPRISVFECILMSSYTVSRLNETGRQVAALSVGESYLMVLNNMFKQTKAFSMMRAVSGSL